jgi:L-iditol 2-dehydrogenase
VAKAFGARRVTGVDPIDRDGIGKEFGVDTIVRATSDRWVSHLDANDRPDIVIDAVGHQVATLGHAIEAAAFGGTVFYFGVPDDDSYPISMRTMLRNNLTLKSGVTLDRRRVLCAANELAREHPELLTAYVTHTFGVDGVQAAFELACRPTPERIKIAVVG